MKLINKISSIILAAATLTACDDSTSTIGSSLITDDTEIVIDSSFVATGHSVANNVVQSKTITQLLGKLDAKEFGTFSSDFVSQFMPAMSIDTTGVTVEQIDSIKLVMFMTPGDFTGDSLVPMGLDVYRLNKALPSPIYSDFNPDGYYDATRPMGSKIYTGHAMHNDSLNSLSFRSITVDLPRSYGQELYSSYLQHPDLFASPEQFAQWFPGIYVTNSFGSGRVINISETRLNMYYRKNAKDTVDGVEVDTVYNLVRSYFAVTPEVINNNNINLTISPQITAMVNSGKSIIVAPAGMEVQMTFPAQAIIDTYRKNAGQLSVLNGVTIDIPAIAIDNDYGINPPENVLMVLTSKKNEFFEQNKITDNKIAFLATYSESKKTYSFPDMRQYIIDLLEKESLSADDYTFTLTPVNVQTETTSSSYYQSGASYITSISPYVTKPALVELDMENAKIKVTFTRQYANN